MSGHTDNPAYMSDLADRLLKLAANPFTGPESAALMAEAANALRALRPEERLREAESVILRLTMDHNSSPNYVLGFEEAREYFCKYPPLPPQSSPQNGSGK